MKKIVKFESNEVPYVPLYTMSVFDRAGRLARLNRLMFVLFDKLRILGVWQFIKYKIMPRWIRKEFIGVPGLFLGDSLLLGVVQATIKYNNAMTYNRKFFTDMGIRGNYS